MNKRLRLLVLTGCFAIAGLTASAARAEVVSYDFAASSSGSSITGSFSYNSSAGWYGGSSTYADPKLQLTLNQVPETASYSTTMWLEYNGKTLTIQENAATTNSVGYTATLVMTGQNSVGAITNGALPTSLSLGNGAGGMLTLSSNGSNTVYSLTSLTPGGSSKGSTSTPELDPSAGAGALALVLGGVGMVFGRRRRRG